MNNINAIPTRLPCLLNPFSHHCARSTTMPIAPKKDQDLTTVEVQSIASASTTGAPGVIDFERISNFRDVGAFSTLR